jgi:hypothetical protein
MIQHAPIRCGAGEAASRLEQEPEQAPQQQEPRSQSTALPEPAPSGEGETSPLAAKGQPVAGALDASSLSPSLMFSFPLPPSAPALLDLLDQPAAQRAPDPPSAAAAATPLLPETRPSTKWLRRDCTAPQAIGRTSHTAAVLQTAYQRQSLRRLLWALCTTAFATLQGGWSGEGLTDRRRVREYLYPLRKQNVRRSC